MLTYLFNLKYQNINQVSPNIVLLTSGLATCIQVNRICVHSKGNKPVVVNIMFPGIARSSAHHIFLRIYGEHILVSHEEGFPRSAPSQHWEMIENENKFYVSWKEYSDKGFISGEFGVHMILAKVRPCQL